MFNFLPLGSEDPGPSQAPFGSGHSKRFPMHLSQMLRQILINCLHKKLLTFALSAPFSPGFTSVLFSTSWIRIQEVSPCGSGSVYKMRMGTLILTYLEVRLAPRRPTPQEQILFHQYICNSKINVYNFFSSSNQALNENLSNYN